MTVHEVIEGATVSRTDASGLRATRVFRVTDLSVAGANVNALIQAGLDELGYAREDPHPGPTPLDVLQVSDITGRALNNTDTVEIVVNYRQFFSGIGSSTFSREPEDTNDPNTGVRQVGASVVRTQTDFAYDGTPIYVVKAIDEADPAQGATPPQPTRVDIDIPMHVMRLERVEAASPKAKADTYVGTINDGTIWGYGAHKVMCRALTGRSDDGGQTWTVVYEFQLALRGSGNADIGWNVMAVYNPRPANATLVEPPTGIGGLRIWRIYEERNFGGLNINF